MEMVRDFDRLTNSAFDLLVCGGGIYGAWTAYDAALRGLRVALVDQGDWANATSSASSKLIHGGLRYLEQFDFKLVRKSLVEREMLFTAGPHRVQPLRFGVPVYRGRRLIDWRLFCGLTLYDLLAGRIGLTRGFRRYNGEDFGSRFRNLRTQDLTAGYVYVDGQTDDGRLVLELVAGALAAGAVCVNYCSVVDWITENGKLSGAVVQNQINNEVATVSAKQFVNTSGRWAKCQPDVASDYRLTKGVHLVLPPFLGQEALLLTENDDGRVFFLIPWYGKTLVGTTDTDYVGNMDHVDVNAADIQYLLNAVNQYSADRIWSENDVLGAFAGVRVLRPNNFSSPSAVSRDWELHVAENGLLTSIGGKISSARSDARQIVDKVSCLLGNTVRCSTFGKPLPWAPKEHYKEWCDSIFRRAEALAIDDESVKWLIFRHGRRAADILDLCADKNALSCRITPELPFILADFLYCLRTEMVCKLEDLLRRRVPLLILMRPDPELLRRLADLAAVELHWSQVRTEMEWRSCCKGYGELIVNDTDTVVKKYKL